jgi:uncharacterized membrane protein (UPF0127 family)
MPYVLINDRTHGVIADELDLALTRRERRRGLLGRDGLAPRTGMMLSPCAAIHTAFMRFKIDVVFIDGHGRALHVIHALKPWRLAACPRARAVIELAAGTIDEGMVAKGDRLYVAPAKPEAQSLRSQVAPC